MQNYPKVDSGMGPYLAQVVSILTQLLLIMRVLIHYKMFLTESIVLMQE